MYEIQVRQGKKYKTIERRDYFPTAADRFVVLLRTATDRMRIIQGKRVVAVRG